MNQEIPEATPPLTVEEQLVVAKLTDADIQAVDTAILSQSSKMWLKVARVVTYAKEALNDNYPEVPHGFYQQRIIQLAEEGLLESQGNLEYMRFSEVRLPAMAI